MMNIKFRKVIVFVVIGLFIVTGILPSINGDNIYFNIFFLIP